MEFALEQDDRALIKASRQSCCSQDDQIGPLEKTFELPDGCTLDDLLRAVTASRFLQFSSTYVEMSCRIGGVKVATVFSPHALPMRPPVFDVRPDTLIRSIGSGDEIEVRFVFDRA